ncbi:MAG: hypothetical protein ACREGL_11015, partial [Alphaproteobacteria bacterium]
PTTILEKSANKVKTTTIIGYFPVPVVAGAGSCRFSRSELDVARRCRQDARPTPCGLADRGTGGR